MLVFPMVFARFRGELSARSGLVDAGAAPLGEREDAGISNCFRKVLRRGLGLVWFGRRRRRPPRRAPECWYFQWFSQGFEARSRPDLVWSTQALALRRAPECWYFQWFSQGFEARSRRHPGGSKQAPPP